MIFTEKESNVILRDFSLVASSQTGKHMRVVSISDGELGYTRADNIIRIALEHKHYKGLPKAKSYIAIKGVFAHELLHQLITNFHKYFPAIKARPSGEQEIFAEILNICEDAAIEFFAPEYLSREYIHALEVLRSVIYEKQPELQTKENPFAQFVTAMLHFRFFGFLKGDFTNEAAADIFKACMPYLYQVVEEPTQAGRIEYAQKIMDISKPLWEEEAKNTEALNELLENTRRPFGYSLNGGDGNGSDSSGPESGDSSIKKRCKITFRRVSPEEYKKAMENADKSGGGIPDGDIDVLIPDSPVEEKEKETSGSGVSVPSESSHEDSSSEDEEGTNPHDADSSNAPADEKDGSKGHSTSKSDCKDDSPLSEGCDVTVQPVNDFDESKGEKEALEAEIKKEAVLSNEELLAIHEIHQRALHEDAKEQDEKSKDDLTDFDIPVCGGYENVCKNARCQNIQVQCPTDATSHALYNSIVESMSGQINGLASKLNRIFKNRREERMYKQSGKISVKRLNCGRVTSRVFTKRRLPDAADLAVVVAVDISGSMHGSKIATARQTAIALAEVFGKLNVPLYIFGFTADEAGFDVNHYHYINWSNQKSDRLRLLSIQNRADNFDGYSIRYAAELIQKKDAEKKLIFVISDGMPAADAYYHTSGVQDVRLAVNEANHAATTIGILLGNDVKPERHREMYGYNFIHCSKVEDLFPQLGKMLVKNI